MVQLADDLIFFGPDRVIVDDRLDVLLPVGQCQQGFFQIFFLFQQLLLMLLQAPDIVGGEQRGGGLSPQCGGPGKAQGAQLQFHVLLLGTGTKEEETGLLRAPADDLQVEQPVRILSNQPGAQLFLRIGGRQGADESSRCSGAGEAEGHIQFFPRLQLCQRRPDPHQFCNAFGFLLVQGHHTMTFLHDQRAFFRQPFKIVRRYLPPSIQRGQKAAGTGRYGRQDTARLTGGGGTAFKAVHLFVLHQADKALFRHIGRLHLQHSHVLQRFQERFSFPAQRINAHPFHTELCQTQSPRFFCVFKE